MFKIAHHFRVSLEDVYNGATSQVEYTRKVICTACKGLVGVLVCLCMLGCSWVC